MAEEQKRECVPVIIEGDPKEIATLVVETQGRLCSQKTFAEIFAEMAKEYQVIVSQKATGDTGQEAR